MSLKVEPYKFNFINDVIKSLASLESLIKVNTDKEEFITPEVTIERVRSVRSDMLLSSHAPSHLGGDNGMDEFYSTALSEISTHFLLNDRLLFDRKEAMSLCDSTLHPDYRSCPLCDHKESRRHLMKMHIKSSHKDYKPFACPVCPYKSVERKMLKRHYLSVHQRYKPFKCTECDYSASLNSNLKKHIDNVHRKNKPYKCVRCDYSSCEKGKLKRHEQSMHCNAHCSTEGPKPRYTVQLHRCGECSTYLYDEAQSLRHMAQSHRVPNPHKCRKCDTYFSTQSRVDYHSLTSHSRRDKTFVCDACDKVYKDKRSMKIHVLSVHLKEKPIKCNMCSYRTVDARYIRKHIMAYHTF